MFNNKKRSGFTLIELIISVFLSGIVLTAAFGMFVSANKVFQSTGEASMTMQAARAAIDIMSAEIEMAGMGTLAPDSVRDLATAQLQNDNIPFMIGSQNQFLNGSDRIQFRASIGGMTMLGSPVAYNDFISGQTVALNDPQGADLFQDGDLVYIMDAGRNIYGSAAIASVDDSSIPNTISITNFVAYPNAPGISQFPVGTVIVSRPLVYTYQLDDKDRLLRCVRLNYSEDCNADTHLNKVPTPGDPETTYVLAYNVEDLQFSYLLGTDPSDPAASTGWQPDPSSSIPLADLSAVKDRLRIRAVKIEALVRSDNPNPMRSNDDCTSGMIKKYYYLGDNTVNVSDNNTCGFDFVQVSNIVKVPNAI